MSPARRSPERTSSNVLVDAHVHFHRAFSRESSLEAALSNFTEAAGGLGLGMPARHVLLVMEAGRERPMRSIREEMTRRGTPDSPPRWTFEPTAEPQSLWAVRDGDARLLLVEGRQVVTAERLEVLATPCGEEIAEGQPLPATLRAVRGAGALPILPWGVGKWWGRRGRLVAETLEREAPGSLCVGDNGGRPALSWKPRLLTLAAQRGFGVLRGSDPLRLRGEAARTGSFGFLLRSELDPERPATSLAELLRGVRGEPTPFGRGVGPLAFLRNQVGIRLSRAAK